ncbi:MAG: GNAT family N-acetyltransferase, partial [Thalassobaculaceae bacterium]|nr:GNAT family N-acetyltransferase [Thalassobaculaceae bacterium]
AVPPVNDRPVPAPPMPDFEIALTTQPSAQDLKTLTAGMRHYELSRFPDLPDESEDVVVAVFARDVTGSVIGGVRASAYWNGLEVDVLRVDDGHRRRGIARVLMDRVEAFARKHGAVIYHMKKPLDGR